MKINIIFFLLASLNFYFLQNKTFAQPQLWEIYTTSNQPFVNVIVDKYESDSLYLKFMDQLIVIHQDSIKCLIEKKESHLGIGILIGAVAGGLLVGTSFKSDGLFSEVGQASSITLGIVLGGVLGGVAGSAAGADRNYYFEKFDSERKGIILNDLFP